MEVIKKARKGQFLGSLEKYHIFLASKQLTHMNEFNMDEGDPVFKVKHSQNNHIDSSTKTTPSPLPPSFRETYTLFEASFNISIHQETLVG
jgi:hypothetical protein